jgi:pyruvate/2-oxoglutarate dehydrogenase complex dihydrolipoamide dehydrogenase (E3) component
LGPDRLPRSPDLLLLLETRWLLLSGAEWVLALNRGGTCLNHGCIPSKMLIHVADVVSELEESHRFNIIDGVTPETIKVEKDKLLNRVCSSIDADSDSIAPMV